MEGRRRWHPTPALLPGKSHGQRSLVGCSPWGFEESTRLSDFTFTFHFHALGKEMAAHSSVLAWRIPGMGSLVGCHLWGRTESDTTEVTQQQQQWKCGVPTTGQPIPFPSWSHAAAAAAKLLQSCLTLCDPIDGSPSGSAVPGILQARTLEWVAISFSNA